MKSLLICLLLFFRCILHFRLGLWYSFALYIEQSLLLVELNNLRDLSRQLLNIGFLKDLLISQILSASLFRLFSNIYHYVCIISCALCIWCTQAFIGDHLEGSEKGRRNQIVWERHSHLLIQPLHNLAACCFFLSNELFLPKNGIFITHWLILTDFWERV